MASILTRTLSRTISGTMYYEKVLRILANLEQVNEDTTDNLLGENLGTLYHTKFMGMRRKSKFKSG